MKARIVKPVAVILIACLAAVGCGASTEIAPGQLALRAMEVRPIDASYDVAFRAATHALFALGLTVKHTEKSAGILSASRTQKNTGAKVGWILLFGIAGAFVDTKSEIDVTMFLSPAGDKQTRMRIGLGRDGKIVVDQQIIDRIWVITQREALIESGETVPAELEAQAQKILSASASENLSTEQQQKEEEEEKDSTY